MDKMKSLYLNEILPKCKVANPETFCNEYSKYIKKTKTKEFLKDDNDDWKIKDVKVVSITNKQLIEVTEENIGYYKANTNDPKAVQLGGYAFSCDVVVNVIE
jgi:hypothetical protein